MLDTISGRGCHILQSHLMAATTFHLMLLHYKLYVQDCYHVSHLDNNTYTFNISYNYEWQVDMYNIANVF